MFGVPAATEFDLRFRLFGMPVRVHPLFWVMAAILGSRLQGGTTLLIWVACVFVSILVHEFGHALVARAGGAGEPQVLLYGMGGLCVYENRLETPGRRLLVLMMGPGAGFLLLAITLGVAQLWLKVHPLDAILGDFSGRRLGASLTAVTAVDFLVRINLFWGIFNLLPIMPLDGGQIAAVLLNLHNRRLGLRRAYILSVVVAGLVAAFFVRIESYPNALLMGLLAFSSFQMLQVLHHQASMAGGYEDDPDWWKR